MKLRYILTAIWQILQWNYAGGKLVLLPERVYKFVSTGECDPAATTIIFHALGVEVLSGSKTAHPDTTKSLRRCVRLTQAIPEARQYLPRLSQVSPEWRRIVDRWEEVEVAVQEDAANPIIGGFSRTKRLLDEIMGVGVSSPVSTRHSVSSLT